MAFRRWIRCRDLVTGHHIDVEERQLDRMVRAKAVEPIEGYPVNEGQNVAPRPPKHNVNLGKQSNDASIGEAFIPKHDQTPAAPASTSAPPRRNSSRTATAAPEADTTSAEGADK